MSRRVNMVNGSSLTKMGSKFEFNDSYIDNIIQAAGIFNPRQDKYNKFARTSYMDPYNMISTTKEFIFFTKPDLHIFNGNNSSSLNPELANVPIFNEGLKKYNMVLQQLQSSCKDNSSPFMNLLSNSVRSNLDLPDVNSDDITTSTNTNGINMRYRKNSIESDNAPDFSLEFEDTMYLEVYMLFKFYDEYERLKTNGTVSPEKWYILNKILHDQYSVYKFIVGEDMETIIYYAKWWGVYTPGYSRSALSELSTGGGFKFTQQFKAQWVKDMDPTILVSFNRLCAPLLNRCSRYIEWYDNSIGGSPGTWAKTPIVESVDTNRSYLSNKKYVLRWKV